MASGLKFRYFPAPAYAQAFLDVALCFIEGDCRVFRAQRDSPAELPEIRRLSFCPAQAARKHDRQQFFGDVSRFVSSRFLPAFSATGSAPRHDQHGASPPG